MLYAFFIPSQLIPDIAPMVPNLPPTPTNTKVVKINITPAIKPTKTISQILGNFLGATIAEYEPHVAMIARVPPSSGKKCGKTIPDTSVTKAETNT